jgi:DNA-binding transcriptional LysR family regulator
MSDLLRLELLVELRRRGTLTAVAEARAYSTSAVSQHLAALQREIGAALLEPDGRRVRLTPQAELLADHAEAILDRWEQARSDVAASLGQTIGTVRVAAFQTATAVLVPPLADWLATEHPALELQAVQQEPEVAVPGVLARDYDLAIAEWYPGQQPQHPAGLHEATLLDDPMRLATLPASSIRTLRDCADERWIFEPAGSPAHSWAVALCRSAGFEPQVAFESPDVRVQEQYVARGLAVALLPDLMWFDSRPQVALHPLGDEQSRTIYTVVRSGAEHHPLTVAVRDGLGVSVQSLSLHAGYPDQPNQRASSR